MNATPLPTPITGPSAIPAQNSARSRAGEAGGASQFKQHLAREVDQRQGAATAPAATSGAANNTPKQQLPALDKAGALVRASEPAVAPASSVSAESITGAGAGQAGKIVAAGIGSDEELTAPLNPMVDLINLMASFNQPAALAARPALAGGADAAGTDGSAQASLLASGLAGVTDTRPGQAAGAAIGDSSQGQAAGAIIDDPVLAQAAGAGIGSTSQAQAAGADIGSTNQAQAAGAALGATFATADSDSAPIDTRQIQAAGATVGVTLAGAGDDSVDSNRADWSKVLNRLQGGATLSAIPSQAERGAPPSMQHATLVNAARLPEALPPAITVRPAAGPAASALTELAERAMAARSEGAPMPAVDGSLDPRAERQQSGAATAPAPAPAGTVAVASADMQLARTDSAALAARPGGNSGNAGDALAMADSGPAAPLAGPQQAAPGAMNPAAGLAAAEKIPARVGTPAWDNQVAQKVVWMVAGDEQSATMTLNPPDMGPMQIVLSVTNDQASVTFSSATPEVRQALEDALPKLREMMSESGVSLGEATVNDGRDEQRQAQESGQRQRNGNGNGSGSGSGRDGDLPPEPARPPRRRGPDGLVDTFA